MTGDAWGWNQHDLGEAPVVLTFPPIRNQELPRHFAVDTLTGGSFKADRAELEKLCDQILGVDREWELQSDEVEVDWGRTEAIAQPASEHNTSRAMTCSFLCVRLLVAPRDAKTQLRTVITHLFVDHAWAMTFGRELFGFAALFAVFEQSSEGVVVKLDAAKPGDYQPVVTFKVDAVGPRPPKKTSFWGKINAHPDDSSLRTIPFVQTKQMRDGLQAARACYRTLVDGQIRFELDDGGVQSASSTLIIAQGGPVAASDLGLTSPAKSSAGYRTGALKLSVKVASPAQSPVVRSGRAGPSLRQRHGDLQSAPPYLFKDVEIVGFRLPVRHDLLQALCDTWLNDPFPGRSYRYQPANVDLVVEYLHYPSMQADNPPFGVAPDALTSQRELVFRILVGRVDDDGRAIRSPAVFCPFVFVDNTQSMISGREVIGYPKLLAKFQPCSAGGQSLDGCLIDAVTPNPTTRDRGRRLLTIDCRFERVPRDFDEYFDEYCKQKELIAASRFGSIVRPVEVDFAWWGLGELQSGGANPETFIEPWLSGQTYGYSGLQVKRFNDARSVRRECYHELVECDYTLLKAAVTQPSHDATLYFPEDDVYGIAEAFGFGPVVPVPPGSWYFTKADFAFGVVDPLA